MFGFKIEFYFDIQVKKQNREFLFVGNWATWEGLKVFKILVQYSQTRVMLTLTRGK